MDEQRYRKFEIWQRGMDLVTSVYRVTRTFPPSELYALTNQLNRAVVSIPSNIAEGSYRKTKTDFKQFLSIALGSLAEVDTQLEIAERLGYWKYSSEMREDVFTLLKMIRAFITALGD